ncbi:hypothetical protein [Lentiprolixibacter aurantiacus]|uniref:Uncharacterized protein n=1 Tax=Lentiprolixibacter aurantiacus TaxID=2993939 RepID=A0AAE3MIV4_9FLAO|nr:hypothetical protein [Lentiprolixibacter aurantiacus]MCX2718116.1 hypothetical protein [Lentiprolixibacter aurantiacus]
MNKAKFYGNAYIFLAISLVIIAVGFSQSYFSKLDEMAFPYHLHGISASLWMILLVTQPYLYKIGKIKLHRKLGWVSLILVPLIVIGGVIMIKSMINRQAFYPPGSVYKLAFIDVVTLSSFIGIYALAIYHRKRLKLHARLMIITIFGPLLPALTRVFFVFGLADNFNSALTYSYLIIELVLLYIIWREREAKEMSVTYLPFLLFIVVQHILMYYAGGWEWWVSTLNYLTGYSG